MNIWQWGACGLAAFGLGVVAWLFLPVGDVHGHTKRLHEWWHWRDALRWERVRQEIAEIEASPEAGQVERLARLFNQTAPHALERADVTEALVATGDDSVLPVVEEWIQEEWPGVLNGIGKAVENRRADTEFRRGAFDALAIKLRDICASENHPAWSATSVASKLLLLSRERGADRIRASLDPASRSFIELVEFSTRNEVLIPVESVRFWLHQAEGNSMEARIGKQVVTLLAALGRSHPEEAIVELEKLMGSQPAAEEDAADALITLLDLPHPLGSLIDLDYDQLGPEEQVASLVHHFGYYRANLFAHALLEDNGHRLPQMEAALRKAGAVKSAEVVAKIRRELPAEGLPSDEKARYAAVHNGPRDLETAALRILEEADTGDENHFLLAMRYVLAHRHTILARRRAL